VILHAGLGSVVVWFPSGQEVGAGISVSVGTCVSSDIWVGVKMTGGVGAGSLSIHLIRTGPITAIMIVPISPITAIFISGLVFGFGELLRFLEPLGGITYLPGKYLFFDYVMSEVVWIWSARFRLGEPHHFPTHSDAMRQERQSGSDPIPKSYIKSLAGSCVVCHESDRHLFKYASAISGKGARISKCPSALWGSVTILKLHTTFYQFVLACYFFDGCSL
jgi:hypothetical protein